MGAKGTQTTNTSQNQTYSPTGSNYITGALNQAQGLAGQGFNVPTAPVAGFSGQQTNAFGLANNTGIANPYIQQASQNFQQGSQPDISQFYNPESSAVTAQLGNLFGQQNAQNNGSLTQAAGGVGADRIAIGQGNLANQQGLAAGQTLSGLYTQSANQALQEQGAQQSAGYGQLAAGNTAQQANVGDINTLLGTGGLQQQLSQAQLNAPYQQQLAQLALPYQLSQFGTNATASLAPALGGTTAGTGVSNSQYNPSLMSQILGTGAVAGSLFLNRGGGIPMFAGGGMVNPYGYDSGGGINFGGMGQASATPIDVSKLFQIPGGQGGGGGGAAQSHQANLNLTGQQPNMAQQTQQGMNQFMQLGKMAGNNFGSASFGGGNLFSGDAWGGDANNPIAGLSAADYGAASGGAIDGPFGHTMSHRFPQGYDDGGSTPMDDAQWPFGPKGGPSDNSPTDFAGRAAPVQEAIATGDFDPQGMNSTEFKPGSIPMPKERPPGAPSAAPMVASDQSPGVDSAPPSQTGPSASPEVTTAPTPPDQAGSSNPFSPMVSGFRDKVNAWAKGNGPLLMAAGLGAWTPGGIAGGFQQGMKLQQGQQEIDQASKRLEMEHEQIQQRNKFNEDKYNRLTPHEQWEEGKPFQAGTDLFGHPIMVTKDKDGNYINVLTGKKAQDPRSEFEGSSFQAPGTSGQDDASIPASARYTAGENVPEGVNAEILQKLPPQLANTIRAVDEGRQSLTSVPMKEREAVIQYLNMYDPGFDQTTYTLRNKQQGDLSTNGNAGKMILAVNQLLPHLKTASDAAEALHNSNYPAANTFKNFWANATGAPEVKKFQEVREVAAMDAARLLRGSGQMAEKDIEFWRHNLSEANSPRQLQEQINMLSNDLIGARIGSIKQSYQMNMRMKAPEFVSPEAQEAAKAIRLRVTPQGQPQHQQGQPQQPQPQQQAQPGAGGGPTPPTPEAIAHLKQNPALRQKFDEKFGPGASAKILGQ